MKLTKRLFLIAFCMVLSYGGFAQSIWNSDPNHSKLGFSTVHMGISDIAGVFHTFNATITANAADFSDAQFTLSVEVTSINTFVDMRDEHLRSEDFFHVAQFPTMTFKSTAIRKVGTDKYKLTGDLTMHGVTHPVEMDLWYRGTIENPQSKALTAGFQLTGTLKRSDFNLGSKFPALLISDEVQVKADGEFVKQEG